MFSVEEDYKKNIISKFQSILDQAKLEIKEYGYNYNYKVVETNKFIDLIFGSNLVVIRMKSDYSTASVNISFELSIKEVDVRKEYIVFILPNSSNLRIPKCQ